jgi:sugar phosphate isomerase/epimerase
MPKLAAFPKAFMDALCIDGSLSLDQWIQMASELDVDGLEFYSGFLDIQDPAGWPGYRKMVENAGMTIPMLCCSPDFSHPDPAFRQQQIDKEKSWIDMTAELGGSYCRVLSGQRRPELSDQEGLKIVAESIEACLEHASGAGVKLIIENHYKDNYWTYPEFAQKTELFCALVDRIDSPHFGVNYDPSNVYLAGDDPLRLLQLVKHRVLTMHASDRYLKYGTLEDLRKEENVEGYVDRLAHGEIGQGLNDYDAIFGVLKGVGFDSWISIEDGVTGMEELARSVAFLRGKIAEHWG